jgi:hypothetical protein
MPWCPRGPGSSVVGALSALVGFTGVRRYARAYQP